AIAEYLAGRSDGVAGAGGAAVGAGGLGHAAGARDAAAFPDTFSIALAKVQDLRYGENPDQPAAFYAEADAPADSLPELEQLHGKALSFNNLLDVDAALFAASAWHGSDRAACVIIKHTTPCGVALGDDAEDA